MTNPDKLLQEFSDALESRLRAHPKYKKLFLRRTIAGETHTFEFNPAHNPKSYKPLPKFVHDFAVGQGHSIEVIAEGIWHFKPRSKLEVEAHVVKEKGQSGGMV